MNWTEINFLLCNFKKTLLIDNNVLIYSLQQNYPNLFCSFPKYHIIFQRSILQSVMIVWRACLKESRPAFVTLLQLFKQSLI